MLGTPEQNDVVERCNRTPKDMVRSMLSNLILLESLWEEALKMAMHIINMVLSKVVKEHPTNYELDVSLV